MGSKLFGLGLQKIIENAKKKQYIVEGALEAENLKPMNKSKAVIEDFAEIPMWGEISNGALKNLWFENDGNAVKFKITEQFEKSNLKICAAVGTNCGQFNIYVNGKLKSSQDLFSSNLGMTNPLINLGENEPVENVFIIKFIYNGHNKSARTKNKKYALGLDYFIIENNFLKR